jgi:hypothetical protein
MQNKKVDFLIIGAQKAGTTSLYRYLVQHPALYFSDVKEVNYFVLDHLYAKGESYYHAYFRRYRGQPVVGSAYVHLLPCAKAAARVKAYNPGMKLVVLLREPVDRAWSAYHYALRNGWEDSRNRFADCIALEPGRLAKEQYDLAYFYNGLYHRHLTHWLSHFDRSQLLLLRLDDLRAGPAAELDRLFGFLGLPPAAIDTTARFNEASAVFSRGLQKAMLSKRPGGRLLKSAVPQALKVFVRSRIFPAIYKLNTRKAEALPALPDEDRRLAAPLFADDRAALQRDFGIAF